MKRCIVFFILVVSCQCCFCSKKESCYDLAPWRLEKIKDCERQLSFLDVQQTSLKRVVQRYKGRGLHVSLKDQATIFKRKKSLLTLQIDYLKNKKVPPCCDNPYLFQVHCVVSTTLGCITKEYNPKTWLGPQSRRW